MKDKLETTSKHFPESIKRSKRELWKILTDLVYEEGFFDQVYDIERDCNNIADSINCNIIPAPKNQLQIDIDCEEQYAYYRGRMDDLDNWFDLGELTIEDVDEKPSKSGLPNRHITITLNKEIEDPERIMLQFLFGSDILRECLNALRHVVGVTPNVLFFEPKEDKQ